MKKLYFIILLLNIFIYSNFLASEMHVISPIHIACANGDINSIRTNLKYKNDLDFAGDRPIHCAARNLQIEAIKLLVANEVSIDSTNGQGMTPLHLVASLGSANDVRAILDLDADINLQDRILHSCALHYATFNENINALQVLLSYRSNNPYKMLNINLQNKLGETALHLAVQKNNLPIILFLINSGINKNIQDFTFKTALGLAIELQLIPAITMILNSGVPVNLDLPVMYSSQEILPSAASILPPPGFEQMQRPQLLDSSSVPASARVSSVLPNNQAMQANGQEQPKSSVISEAEMQAPQATPIKGQKKVPINQNVGLARIFQEVSQGSPAVQVRQEELSENVIVQESQTVKSDDYQEAPQDISAEDLTTKVPTSLSQTEVKKVKLSKHQLQKQKEEIAKAKAAQARRNKKIQTNLKKETVDIVQPDEQKDNSDVPQDESVQISQDKATLNAQNDNNPEQVSEVVKKDLSLHVAINRNKSFEIIESLITQESINIANEDGDYPLHIACQRKNLDACKAVLTAGAIIDQQNNLNLTALHFAVAGNSFEIVDLLLGSNADINLLSKKTSKKIITMANQCAIGQFTNLRNFRKLPDDQELHAAACAKPKVKVSDKSVKETLPKQDLHAVAASSIAEPNMQNNSVNELQAEFIEDINQSVEFTFFIESIVSGLTEPLVSFLLAHPEWIYFQNQDGLTPLSLAVMGDSHRGDVKFSATRLLVDLNPGLIIQKNKKDNLTPFHFAINVGNVFISIYLLSKINKIPDLNKQAYLTELIAYCEEQIVSDETNDNFKKILKLLKNSLSNLKSSQNVGIEQAIQNLQFQNNQYLNCDKKALGNLLIHMVQAYELAKVSITRKHIIDLITADADLSWKDEKQATLLHFFASLGDKEIVTLLLSIGMDSTIQDVDGNLALHDAALRGFKNIVGYLIKANKDCRHVTNNKGNMPLHEASSGGQDKIICLLVTLDVAEAKKNENIESVKNFLNFKNKDGLTPLLIAFHYQKESTIKLLLKFIAQYTNIQNTDLIEDLNFVLTLDKEKKYYKLELVREFLMKLNLRNNSNQLTACAASSSSSSLPTSSELESNLMRDFNAISKNQKDKVVKLLYFAIDNQLNNKYLKILFEKVMSSEIKAEVLYKLKLYCNRLKDSTNDSQKKVYYDNVKQLIDEYSLRSAGFNPNTCLMQ